MNKTVASRYLLLSVSLVFAGCANRGIGPQGGPKDEKPPVVLKETPENGTLGFDAKRIEIQFDEYITLDDVSKNVLISPPQQYPPDIKSIGKRVRIEFKEPLKDSTTYTIDFGEALRDNNERNPLTDYHYSFSTGNHIDSLEIYGTMINAENLNPISGIIVGYHSNLNDSAFERLPFDRIGKTNSEGDFSIKNIPPGTYRLFGLGDVSRDYCYQPGEGLALWDSLITPYINIEVEHDTIWLKDTLAADSSLIPDSITTVEYYYYEPSNLLLKFFYEDKRSIYFQRAVRDKAHYFTLYFSAPQDNLPRLTALRPESDSLGTDTTWVDFLPYTLLQANKTRDTLVYWLTDSLAIRQDTLRFAMQYSKTDSLYELQPTTDTVQVIYRAPRMSDKARANMQKKEARTPLQLTSNAKSSFEVYDTLLLISPTPIQHLIPDSLHMERKQDTLWLKMPFTIQAIDSAHLRMQIIFDMQPGTEYRLLVDTGAVTDMYGKMNDKKTFALKVKKIDEYATLKVQLQDWDERAYIQLLDERDNPVRTLKAAPNGTLFTHLAPKTYYLRLFIDANGDGRWTTGDYLLRRQPEEVYYFQRKLTLKANWDFEEVFDWKNIPLLEQKPTAIRKDAAQDKRK